MSSKEILMPKLFDTMEAGVLGRWLRQEGDEVKKGDVIAEIDSDKTTMELVAEATGVLTLVVEEGSSVPTGAIVAKVTAPDVATAPYEASAEKASGALGRATVDLAAARVEGNHEGQVSRRLRATPAARKLAALSGIDLRDVPLGSGPRGRIQRADVVRKLELIDGEKQQRKGATGGGDGERGDVLIEPSRIHLLSAKRMALAKHEIPHFYLSAMVEMSAALELKAAAKERWPELALSITDLVIFACGYALAQCPAVNASWQDGKIVRKGAINVGVAVALDGDDLVVPVVRDVDRLSLRDIVTARHALVTRARQAKLKADELQGGTFTVSNLGSFGVSEVHAIVNPPESGILGVGAIDDHLVIRDGQLLSLPRMKISLSGDHRVFSGATAARFLARVRERIESPALALLDGSI